MPSPGGLPLPDPTLPLKDTLRLMRFAARRGRGLIPAPAGSLPTPVSTMAQSALGGFDQLARRVDRAAGGLSHRFLDQARPGTGTGPNQLTWILAAPRPDIAFAEASYAALTRALRYLGTEDALVSEARAADAFAGTDSATPAAAARLILALRTGQVIQEVVLPADRRSVRDVSDLALLALAFWLLAAEDTPGLNDRLLPACCDLATALAEDLQAAGDDPTKLTRLVATYADRI